MTNVPLKQHCIKIPYRDSDPSTEAEIFITNSYRPDRLILEVDDFWERVGVDLTTAQVAELIDTLLDFQKGLK